MFERFATDARAVVVTARELAAARGDRWVGTEHMLLAVVDDDTAVAQALRSLGLTPERVRAGLTGSAQAGSATDGSEPPEAGPSDAEALRNLGIDLDAVRRRAEELFGPGALDRPFDEAPDRWWRRRRSGRRCTGGEPHAGGVRLRFSAEAKKALELALREAIRMDSREIRLEHVLLGLVRADGAATRLIRGLGIEPGDVRQAVLDLRRAA
jgi:ATP-dependent Clp protease ATP-binding subunit ClpA